MINQKKIELEISEVLKRGDIADISEASGIGYSYLDSQFNPNDPRMSYIVGALIVLCAYRQVSNERAIKVKQIFDREFELAAPTLELSLCARHETGMLAKEVTDIVIKSLEGCPAEVILTEIMEAERQLKNTKYALINEFSKNGAKV